MIISRKKYLSLLRQNRKQRDALAIQHTTIVSLCKVVAEDHKKIKELNARLKFFGITIGTEDPETVGFPSTIKI